MANQLTDENILAALGGVKDPEIGRDLVSLGMVKNITIDGSVVDLTVELTTPACPLKATIEHDIGDALTSLGASLVRVDWASNVKRSFGGPAADLIPGVRNTIAVASGKGGVGKTTVAVNLAVAWRDGARVGLLDADITGPNVPLMMGTQGSPRDGDEREVEADLAHGMKMMIDGASSSTDDTPVIWRGPLIHSASRSSCATSSGATSTTSWSTCRPAPATCALAQPASRSPARSSSRRRRSGAARRGQGDVDVPEAQRARSSAWSRT